VVYERRQQDLVLTFGNTSALYQSDLVMYDHQTLSYWFQVGGEAIIGTLTGARLEAKPSVTTTWAGWLAIHPGTQVLSRDTGYERNSYERNYASSAVRGLVSYLNGGSFPFPVTEAAADDRLPAGELVLGVEIDGETPAYPIACLGDDAINDELGGEPIVILSEAQGPVVAAFPEASVYVAPQ